jgi:lysine 2-monooxygenase
LTESPAPSWQSDLDIAIVGGGVSGIFAAWRLRDVRGEALGPLLSPLAGADGRLRVGLFEYGDRIGGRLFSLSLPGIPDTPVELGGMRFLSTHSHVRSLVEHFGLMTRELPVVDPQGRHIFYLRGQHFTGADWDRLDFEPPYRLERGERGRPPGALLTEVALRHREAAALHPEKYRDRGFWNLLLDELSDQAYRLVRDAGGYETIVNNWNAAEAIPFLLADFAPGASYSALSKGFEEVPRELERRYREADGLVFTRHRLHRLERDGNGLKLVFDHGDPSRFGAGRRVQNEVIVRARHVILAMPRRSIEMLHPDSFIFDCSRFEEDIRSVLPQPGLKIFAAYRRPWWQQVRGVTAGRSVTDLPIRQCYYWLTGTPSNDDAAPSILMASYNDGPSVEFWAGLARRPERYVPPPQACPPGVAIPEDLRGAVAPAALVAEMQRQLCELHAVRVSDNIADGIVPPYFAVFQDWSQDPFGGGWHFWKIGANSGEIIRRLRKPCPDANLHVCGEAWSRQQGWVEGALATASDVLEQELLLPRPSWLAPSAQHL